MYSLWPLIDVPFKYTGFDVLKSFEIWEIQRKVS